jgi:hypothetical protein
MRIQPKIENQKSKIPTRLVMAGGFRHNASRFTFTITRSLERIGQMAEAQQPQTDGDQQVQVLLDERDLRTLYSNAYRIHTAAEEVVVDLGFNMPNPNQQPGQQQQLLFKVTDRVVMSYANAKRLATSLQQLVKRYEQQFGELPAQPGQPRSK